MTHLNEWFPYVVVALSALSTVASLLPSPGERSGLKSVAHLTLALAAFATMAALAHPALLPPSSIAMNADGSSNDPRIPAVIALAVAAYAALVPSLRALRLPALGLVGSMLPGLVLGGVLVSLFYFMHLRSPMALIGILLAGLVAGQAVGLLVRLAGRPGETAGLVLALGAAALVGAGMLSLHGARAQEMQVIQGSAVDTLGLHVAFTGTEAPDPKSRVLLITVGTGADSLVLRPSMSGGTSDSLTSTPDARLLSGPIIVPLALHEMRRKQARGIAWLKKGESFEAGQAQIRFIKYRIEQSDSVRMFADIEVTSNGQTEKLAPGWTAHAGGEVPFSAVSKALGSISVAGMDADNGRVALMFSNSPDRGSSHVALVDLRLRPALPVAWAATALALIGLILGFVLPAAGARKV